MSQQPRYPGIDQTYSQAHRDEMAWQYRRLPGIGHRTGAMIDRDWTEYCYWCSIPLAFIEEVRYLGDRQFRDKATTVTRETARLARRPAFLLGWQTDRPAGVQQEIDRLHAEIRRLEALHPITGFHARWLTPFSSPVPLTPGQWWEWIYLMHRDHHYRCPVARQHEFPVRADLMYAAFADHPLNLLGMAPLFGPLIAIGGAR